MESVLHIRKCMHGAIALRSLENILTFFSVAKQLLVFHLVYNVLLMLQCTYKFKHITQNNDVACNLIIRYVLVYDVVY